MQSHWSKAGRSPRHAEAGPREGALRKARAFIGTAVTAGLVVASLSVVSTAPAHAADGTVPYVKKSWSAQKSVTPGDGAVNLIRHQDGTSVTGTGGNYAYNFANVSGDVVGTDLLTNAEGQGLDRLNEVYNASYFNQYKDTCLPTRDRVQVGQVVTCDAKRTVTFTYTEPVWYPSTLLYWSIRHIPKSKTDNRPVLTMYEEPRIVSINDGAKDYKPSEYAPIEVELSAMPSWSAGLNDAGELAFAFDTSKYSATDGDPNWLGTFPDQNPMPYNATAWITRLAYPGYVKTITVEYTPKFFINSLEGVDKYHGLNINSGSGDDTNYKNYISWDGLSAEGKPKAYTQAYPNLPSTTFDVTKDFVEESVAPGEDVNWTISVSNNPATKQDSYGYYAVDQLPADIDPATIELVSGPGEAHSFEVSGSELILKRVAKGYTVAADGRVTPDAGTDTTMLPPEVFNSGEKDVWHFKAKTASDHMWDRIDAAGVSCAPGADTGLEITNSVTFKDSIVNPGAEDDATVKIVCPFAAFDFTKSVKDFNPATAKVGDVVTYTFEVTNTGTAPLKTFEITDPMQGLSALTYPDDRSLAAARPNASPAEPGETKTATATYTLTQADIDRGTLVNNATASVTPENPRVKKPKDKQGSVPLEFTRTADFEFVKSTDFDWAKAEEGDVVTYSFEVKNTGNVTLDSFDIKDPLAGLSPLTCPADTSLKPGEVKSCTATYTLTSADFLAAKVDNTATATVVPVDPTPGDTTDDITPPDPKDSSVTGPLEPEPGIAMKKTADKTRVSKAGDKVTYTFHVTNTGNVTVNEIKIIEGDFNGAGKLEQPVCAAKTLAPGDSTDCTTVYTVVDKDITVGKALMNTATATGVPPVDPKDPNGPNPPITTPPSTAKVDIVPASKLAQTGSVAALVGAGALALLILGAAAVLIRRKMK
ncbi:DUF7507 domain-containing protein [Schaalia hyovaginalis]|uniref:DUF7507 domain-containing protein n=1 Tax=Schaalia hyovaginalis TaxID=29316 RepID=UPI0012B2A666|nr:DUF11 domain-containing protein [Schaalia hyovaginalis]MST63785.1 DUF11 domain-containing protein [Schaalia hyovaginalis]